MTVRADKAAAVFIAVALVSSLAGLVIGTLDSSATKLAAVLMGGAVAVSGIAAFPELWRKLRHLSTQIRWWHLCWLLLFLSALVFRVRDIETIESNLFDVWTIYRAGLVAIVAFVLVTRLVSGQTNWLQLLLADPVVWFAGFGIIGVISTVWSVQPFWTLYKSAEYLADVALLASILASVNSVDEYKTLFDLTWVLNGILMISTWFQVLLWPSQTTASIGLLGIQIHSAIPLISGNGTGQLGATLGVVSLARILVRRRIERTYLFVFAVSMATLVFAQSRSPILAFLASALILLVLTRRLGVMGFLAIALLLLLTTTNLGDILWTYFRRGQTDLQFATLTGRIDLWKVGWGLFTDRPLVGFGAYAGTRFIVPVVKPEHVYSGGVISGADNVLIETLLGVGVLGTIPLLIGVARTAWILWKGRFNITLFYSLITEAIAVFSVLLVRSVFAAGVFIWHPALDALLILGFAAFLRKSTQNLEESQLGENPPHPQPLPAARRRGSQLRG